MTVQTQARYRLVPCPRSNFARITLVETSAKLHNFIRKISRKISWLVGWQLFETLRERSLG